MKLTEEQERAVARREGSLLLAAAAGSGKTSVLVERYIRAVLEDDVAPSRILAITFTERAAWELKERLRGRLQDLGRRDLARDVEASLIGTFHGFCARLLRIEALEAALDPGFSILEEGLAERLRLTAFATALTQVMREAGAPAVDLAAAYTVDRLRRLVLGSYAELRSRGELHPRLPLEALEAARTAPVGESATSEAVTGESATDEPATSEAVTADAEAIDACRLIDRLLLRFDDAYEQSKRARSALDFDDLELQALTLLRQRSEVKTRWAERLELMMVDELQDTNRRQLALLAALERENLFTVGDAWQSIYGFRHADVTIFREREAKLAAAGASLALTSNFRSRREVIDAVNAAFADRFGEGYLHLRAMRESDDAPSPAVELLLTDKDGWDDVPELAEQLAAGLPDAPLWRVAEARLLAQRVAELVGQRDVAPGEVAVLLRSTKDLTLYERALGELGVPTAAAVGGFWEAREIVDLLAYLSALANPLDELALLGVLAGPLVSLSLDGLALLARAQRGGERRLGLWELISGHLEEIHLRAVDEGRLHAFRERFASERERAYEASIADLLGYAIVATDGGAGGHGESQGLRGRHLGNACKLVRLAREFERAEGRDLRGFLDHASHLTQSASIAEPDAPADEGEAKAVQLMSIHAAKGLEFPVVCVADLGREGNNSGVPDLLLDGEHIGLRLLRLDGSAPEPTLSFEALRQERERTEAAEEDRVLYVAMTRAGERLLLSGAASFARWPQDKRGCPPIAWLAPALLPDLPARLAACEAGATVAPQAQGGPRCVLSSPKAAERALLLKEDWLVGDPRRAAGPAKLAKAAMPAKAATPAMPATPATPAKAAGPTTPAKTTRQADDISSPGGGEDDAAAAEIGAPRPLEGGSLSYTTLYELERCGYRHYLERALSLRDQSPVVSRASSRLDARAIGEVAHRLLERVDFSRASPPTNAQIEAAATSLGLQGDADGLQGVQALLSGVFSTSLAQRIGMARDVRREQPFSYSLDEREPVVTGVLDLVARERGDARLIVDYKSGELAADVDLDALAEHRYGVQRLIYALAALKDGASEVEVVHWFLHRPADPVHASFEASCTAALEAELLARVRRVRERGYTVTEHPHRAICFDCPGRSSRLCSWGEKEMLQGVPQRDL